MPSLSFFFFFGRTEPLRYLMLQQPKVSDSSVDWTGTGLAYLGSLEPLQNPGEPDQTGVEASPVRDRIGYGCGCSCIAGCRLSASLLH